MLKKGDVCEVIDRKHGHCFQVGATVTVIMVEENEKCGSYRCRSDESRETWWLCEDELEVISVDEGEVEAAIASIMSVQQ
jgi:hypothetical protein